MTKGPLKARGLDASVAYLERVGMEIVERSWETDTAAIDIVAMDGTQLVFVGVTTRKTCRQEVSNRVSASTARRVYKAAATYIEMHSLGDVTWRFDQILLLVVAEDRALLRHVRDALPSGS